MLTNVLRTFFNEPFKENSYENKKKEKENNILTYFSIFYKIVSELF